MTLDIVQCLGHSIDRLLRAEPFSGWHVIRTVENDPTAEVWYEFEGHGVDVICDEFDRIKTVFLHRHGDGESLVAIPFAMGRSQALIRFGIPLKSGRAVRIPGIGDRGAWDRFALPQGVLHIQYSADGDGIDLITLMRPDAVPQSL